MEMEMEMREKRFCGRFNSLGTFGLRESKAWNIYLEGGGV